MMEPLLKLTDISISYEPGQWAVRNVSVSVNEGEVLAVVGGSGSGKTTLLHACIGDFVDRNVLVQGEICFLSENIGTYSEKKWESIRGKEMAMIFQDTRSSFNPNRRIWKQIEEYVSAHCQMSKSEIKERTIEMLKSVDLKDPERVLYSYPFQLSGGMLQRVSIAMSMLLKPRLILADEPTSALDVTVQAQVVSEIRALCDNARTSVIFVTHNMGVASYIADRIAVMEKGFLVEYGTRDQVINTPRQEYTKKLLAAVPEL